MSSMTGKIVVVYHLCDPVKDSDLLEMTSLKKLPSETRTEALLVKYVAYFGICQ